VSLLCTLFGHLPVPLLSWRRRGRWENRCVVCQRTIVHLDGRWRPRDEIETSAETTAGPV
jgi:hypothetical protein